MRLIVNACGWFVETFNPDFPVLSIVRRRSIQRSSRFLRKFIISPLFRDIFGVSIIVKVACSLKLCPGFWKCMSAKMLSGLFESERCPAIRWLMVVVDIPMY